ncbi:hypothetical protein U0070_002534, partial [Myodes glareolus]
IRVFSFHKHRLSVQEAFPSQWDLHIVTRSDHGREPCHNNSDCIKESGMRRSDEDGGLFSGGPFPFDLNQEPGNKERHAEQEPEGRLHQMLPPAFHGLGRPSRQVNGGERDHRPEEEEEEGDAGHTHRYQHSAQEDNAGPAPSTQEQRRRRHHVMLERQAAERSKHINLRPSFHNTCPGLRKDINVRFQIVRGQLTSFPSNASAPAGEQRNIPSARDFTEHVGNKLAPGKEKEWNKSSKHQEE